jgi:hypothetical protein
VLTTNINLAPRLESRNPTSLFKNGPVMGYDSTPMRIQSAFEGAGIRFLDDEAGAGLRCGLQC